MNKEERPGIQSKTKYTGQKEKGYQEREKPKWIQPAFF